MPKIQLNPNKFKSNLQKAVQPARETFEFFNGDSAEVLFKLKPLSIDLVVTSPPYDDLREYKGFSFDFERIAEGLVRVLKPGGVIVWVVNDATVDGRPVSCIEFGGAEIDVPDPIPESVR